MVYRQVETRCYELSVLLKLVVVLKCSIVYLPLQTYITLIKTLCRGSLNVGPQAVQSGDIVTQCAISFDFSIHNNREKHTVFLILSVCLTAVHL